MPVDLKKIKNSPFAVLVWYVQDGKDDIAQVYSGLATWNSISCCVDIYKDGVEKPVMILSGEQLAGIRIVTEDVKPMLLNADYGISMTISDIELNEANGLDMIGLKWQNLS